MARSISNAKVILSLVADNISIASQRRGYAAASQRVAVEVARAASGKKTTTKEEIGRSAEQSWVPDPVTGYYRPANRAAEIDVAELREIFLKQKIRSQ